MIHKKYHVIEIYLKVKVEKLKLQCFYAWVIKTTKNSKKSEYQNFFKNSFDLEVIFSLLYVMLKSETFF